MPHRRVGLPLNVSCYAGGLTEQASSTHSRQEVSTRLDWEPFDERVAHFSLQIRNGVTLCLCTKISRVSYVCIGVEVVFIIICIFHFQSPLCYLRKRGQMALLLGKEVNTVMLRRSLELEICSLKILKRICPDCSFIGKLQIPLRRREFGNPEKPIVFEILNTPCVLFCRYSFHTHLTEFGLHERS